MPFITLPCQWHRGLFQLIFFKYIESLYTIHSKGKQRFKQPKMTAVNKSLIKVIKWKLWAFKPIRRLTLHILLHKNTISSNIERLINPLSPFKIHEISISNPLLKIVFETSSMTKTEGILFYINITKTKMYFVKYSGRTKRSWLLPYIDLSSF